MYRIKAQIQNECNETCKLLEPGFPLEYGTEFEAREAIEQAAEAYQAKHGGDKPFHDKHGLSTVFNIKLGDDYSYACFSFSEIGA